MNENSSRSRDTAVDPLQQQQQKKKKRTKPWGVLEWMVALMGVSVVVSSCFHHWHLMDSEKEVIQTTGNTNGNHNHGRTSTHHRHNRPAAQPKSAVHAALNDFKGKTAKELHKEAEAQKRQRAHDHPEPNVVVGGLSCESYGGPMQAEAVQEMVYWQDIASDAEYVGPFFHTQGHTEEDPRYLTFEPDGGGWNNIRMAMETVIGLGIATGRTIVLPPSQRMYLLAKNRGKEKTDFSFADFFPLDHVAKEHPALNFISTEEFLTREAMSGNMRNAITRQITFPPENRTNWDGQDVKPLKLWLQNSTLAPHWAPSSCMAAFPASGRHKDVEQLHDSLKKIHSEGPLKNYTLDTPTPVDASAHDRLRENLAGRGHLCVYNEEMQKARVVHFMCSHKLRVRMLVHFYAFLFFEDWRDDLWMKRFMRDHLRYTDEIQCAAARVVQKLRTLARSVNPQNAAGSFDTLHVRRGDFQFKKTRIPADEILANVRDELQPGGVIFIATDERDKRFFDVFKKNYTVKFLDDFKADMKGVNTNYFGMIDQVIASRGRVFFGCWHSTFSGFINRIRGYHADKDKMPGYEKGLLPTSYYYATINQKFVMHKYAPLQGAFFNRELEGHR